MTLSAARILVLGLCLLPAIASAQPRPGQPRPTQARPKPPAQQQQRPAQPAVTPTPTRMKKASELIRKQDPIAINEAVLARITPSDSRIVVSISKQRAYLLLGDEVAIDSPISSGKRAGMTPKGDFHVMEKDKNHSSNIYGDFRDARGRIVRGGVSVRIDSAPSGTHFVGAPMKWFMRLTGDGVGMHVGILPGYPASHGCIRMPPQAAQMFYERVKVGTRVDVVP